MVLLVWKVEYSMRPGYKTFLLIINIFFLLFIDYPLNAQWLHFCNFPIGANLNPSFGNADFISQDTGVYYLNNPSVSNSSSVLYQTIDEANAWNTSYSVSGVAAGIYKLFACRKQKSIYIVESLMGLSSLKKSPDGGTTWINYYGIPSFITDLFTCDTNKLYALNRSNSGINYLIKYDNGVKYFQYATFSNVSPVSLFFPDTATGFITASDSVSSNIHLILKTTDGGLNWATIYNDSTTNIRNLYFSTKNTGYGACDSGLIIKTVDGGLNWQQLSTGISVNLNSLYFLNDSVGFAAGDSGVIIRTVNGGMNWIQDQTGTTSPFTKIFFVNDSIGFALVNWKMYKINLNSLIGIWDPYLYPASPLTIFPNPSFGDVLVELPEELKNENKLLLMVYNCTGELVKEEELYENNEFVSLDFKNELRGIYFITLSGNSKIYRGKFLKE